MYNPPIKEGVYAVIVNRVPELINLKFGGIENVNLSEVQRETGLTYVTVSKWYKGQVDRADFPTLVRWCIYFDCEVGELLIYKPGAQCHD